MRDAFERAFVAVSYVLGRRDADLLQALEAPGAEAQALKEALAHPERSDRARALAGALEPIVKAHEARRLK